MIFGLATLLATTTLSDAGISTSIQATAAACDVSLQVVKDLSWRDYGKPIVFDSDDPTFFQIRAEALLDGWKNYESGKGNVISAPPTNLLSAFAGSAKNAVPKCPSVRSWLRRHKIRFGKAAVESLVLGEDDELSAGIFTVSMPSISSDGQTAIIYTSQTWGGLAGEGIARLYRRQPNGSWKFAAENSLWIS